MNSYDKPVSQVITTLACFSGARMAIGAIHTSFLISKGLSLPDFALLQAIFSGTVLLAEVPTGLLSDRIGPKRSLQICSILLLIYFVLGLQAPEWIPLLASSIVYGVCLCLISGSDSSLLKLAIGNREHSVSEFRDAYHKLNQNSSLANCLFGVAGGVSVYIFESFSAPYYLGITLAILCCLNANFIPNSAPGPKATASSTYTQAVMAVKSDVGVTYGVFLIIFTAAMQPVLYFWQPFIIEAFSADKFSDPRLAGLVLPATFGLYTLSKYTSSKYLRPLLMSEGNALAINVTCCFLSAFFLLLTILSIHKQFALAGIFLFSAFHAFVSLPEFAMKGEFSRLTDQSCCATAISILAVFARISGLGFMLFIAKSEKIELTELFSISALLIILLAPLTYRTFKNKETPYVLNK
ncbi:MFS transporter [Pseudomonas sp. X10]